MDRLLSANTRGVEALRIQLASALVRKIDDNGSLKLNAPSGPKAEIDYSPVPVEMECEDGDGVSIHVLLHVVSGRAEEIEIYKDDSSEVKRMPAPAEFRIFTPGRP